MRQADGTGWMGFYSLTMLNIALELAKHNPVYEDIASKFFEHVSRHSKTLCRERYADALLRPISSCTLPTR